MKLVIVNNWLLLEQKSGGSLKNLKVKFLLFNLVMLWLGFW